MKKTQNKPQARNSAFLRGENNMQVPKPSHKRKAPKRGVRGEFDKKTRERILERDHHSCQQCGGRGEQIHHVFFRARAGRGVFTNGLTLCNMCHAMVHQDAELTEYWINVFVDRYGVNFYRDEYDGR